MTIKICINCEKEFSTNYEINGKKKHADKRKFCYTCSPIGYHNTRPSFDDSIIKRDSVTHDVIEKRCDTCSLVKHKIEFYKGHKSCKVCHNNQVIDRQREIKKQCIDYMGGKCCKCGYCKYQGALEFHHLDPTKKDFGISRKQKTNFEDLKKELDKCILICSNCHRELHGAMV